MKFYNPLSNLAVPKNISTLWSFGSLSGLCLTVQIVTGLFLAIQFSANLITSFSTAIYISRDVNWGWLIRSIHANGASIFFICLYIHIGRGIYFKSFKNTKTWITGVTLFLLTIITSFLGYVLPRGQISFWAATVITNLLSTIPFLGEILVIWVWGGFSVNNATLTRFYALHFILPVLIAALSLLHLFFLHSTGSNNPLGLKSSNEIIKFHPYFSIKDLVAVVILWLVLSTILLLFPSTFSDPENFIPADPLITPPHIQPEWYFLPMYAILRAIPRKLGGVIALVASIAILYTLPIIINYSPNRFKIFRQIIFWSLVLTFVCLIFSGAQPVEPPFEKIRQILTIIYFTLFLVLR